MLDLIFSNIFFDETAVSEELKSGSDYEMLLTSLHCRGAEALEHFRYRVAGDDINKFVGLVEAGIAILPNPNAVQSLEKLDEWVNKLNGVYDSALKATGKPARDQGHKAG